MDWFKKDKKAEEFIGGGFMKPPEIPFEPPVFGSPENRAAPIPSPVRGPMTIPAAPRGTGMGFSSAAPMSMSVPKPAPAEEAVAPEELFGQSGPEEEATEAAEMMPEEDFMPKAVGPQPFPGRRDGKELFEAPVTVKDPELLRAFAEILSNRLAVDVIEALISRELSIAEIADMSQMDENEVRMIVQRLHALGMLKATWYQTKDGKHFSKYKFTETKGVIKFDLKDLKATLSVEELEAKSSKLVALVTAEGKVPKSLVMSALGLNSTTLLEQVVRYAGIFKLPDVGSMIMGEAPTTEEPDILRKKVPKKESERLYSELEELETYLGKLK